MLGREETTRIETSTEDGATTAAALNKLLASVTNLKKLSLLNLVVFTLGEPTADLK